MSVRQDEPFEIQPRANGLLARMLQIATAMALVAGLAGALLPGAVGLAAAWTAVAAVVITPLGRVAWLSGRWVRRRDHPFAVLAAGLLLVVIAGGIAASMLTPMT